MIGLQLAAAYSVKPNELGRCGPDGAHRILYDFVKNPAARPLEKIRNLLRQFPVATPYYHLIARANGIDDIFDQGVVEAYWLGNQLLDQIKPEAIISVIENDTRREGWNAVQISLLFEALNLKKARPHHSLSVMYFFLRPGADLVLSKEIQARIDQCRISVGLVVNNDSQSVEVAYRPLVFAKNRVTGFGPWQKKKISRGFLSETEKNDLVSFHLGFGIQKLTKSEANNLNYYNNLTLQALG